MRLGPSSGPSSGPKSKAMAARLAMPKPPGVGAFDTAMRERFMWRDFGKTLRELWQASSGGYGSYRPDLHYMRGPGPKWRAKYGNLPPKTVSTSAAIGPVPYDIAEHRA